MKKKSPADFWGVREEVFSSTEILREGWQHMGLGDGGLQWGRLAWYRLPVVPILLRTEISARIIAHAIIFSCLVGFF